MRTAIVGVGNIGRTIAGHLVSGGEPVILAARDRPEALALSAGSLERGANRTPNRAVLFYATDDPRAQAAAERLISASGFDPVRAGGLDAAIRIEMYGDLHEYGGLNGKLLDARQALAAITGRG